MSITNVITRITVDMAGDVKRFAVKAKQYDRATRVIVVSLLWDEVPYVLDSADTVRCNVHKPDGTIAIVEGDNIAVSGNTVTITLPGTALTAAGRAWADIEIETQDESQQISCQCFEIDIAKSPVDDDSIISTNEFSAMKLATKAANEAAAAATAEIEATAAAGTAASQAAAAAQAATEAANQAAAAATASIQIDQTLTDNTKAAPAGMVGQIKEDLSSLSGLSEDVKQALLACFAKVAWVDEHGQDYYDALEDALYPPANLVSISAVYTQSGTVYDTDSLDSLKPDLVVTAHYSDNTSGVVTGYVLSGTLVAGTSTITVSYGGKTTTFNVTVTHLLWTFSNGIMTVKGGGSIAGYVFRQNTAARACGVSPIENAGYIFTVTDSSKYALAAYDITSMDQHAISAPTAIDRYGYPCSSKTVAWATSDSVTTPYVWLSLKKMDGTAFTDEELANGAAAVFTYTTA